MNNFKILNGDSLELLKKIPDNFFHSVVTDPPYHLLSIVERFGGKNSAPAKDKDGAFKRQSKGFMGQTWDGGDIAQSVEFWKEVMRVMRPGGHLIGFSHSRTYHRMTVAIEDVGFEIRDQIFWLYGSGFPKSHNIAKSIAKKENDEGTTIRKGRAVKIQRAYQSADTTTVGEYEIKEYNNKWNGWGTALKPAHEPIVLARKPLSEKTVAENVLKWETGAINIDECRVEPVSKEDKKNYDKDMVNVERASVIEKNGVQLFGKSGHKPQTKRDATIGRFPANLIHDGSEEVVNEFPHTKKGVSITKDTYKINNQVYGQGWGNAHLHESYGDNGSASRFFYSAKAQKVDRNEGLENFENKHPTVKPTALMSYLIKLVTPKGGHILDPFNGSGSTGKGAAYLNKTQDKDYKYLGMDLDEHFCEISRARIEYVLNNDGWMEKQVKKNEYIREKLK